MTIRQLLCVAICVLVGVAARINGGNYHPAAIALIVAAIVIGLVVIADPFGVASRRVAGRWLIAGLLAAIGVHAVALMAGPLVTAGHLSLDIDPATLADDAASRDIARTTAGVGLCGVVTGTLLCAAATYLGTTVRAGATGRRFSADLWPADSDSRQRNAPRAQIAMLGVVVVLASHLLSGLATVRIAVPPMDVIVFQDFAARELLDGGSPYSMTFLDLSGGTSPYYGPGLQANAQLLFGFPYPPLSLLAVLPAPLSGGNYGDFRFIHALCVTGVGVLMVVGASSRKLATGESSPAEDASNNPSTRGLAAGMFLLTPIAPQVIVNGWTEPLVAVLLAATVAIAVRQPRWMGVSLGLLWSAKQYVPLTAPLMWLLPRDVEASPPLSSRDDAPHAKDTRRGRRLHTLLMAMAAGALVTLPLVLMDFGGFWRSAVTLQLSQPFRPDALSLLSLVHRVTGEIPPSWPAFVALAAVQAIALWRMPRTAACFAAATAVALLVFFALSKQAFANYYFLVTAAAALGVVDRGANVGTEASHARD